MMITEAIARTTDDERCITRTSWLYGTAAIGVPVKIEPTNSPCKCIVWIAEKENSISEWTPMLDDLIASDWIVTG